MADYLTEIEHAVRNTLTTIWEEGERLRQLESEVARLTRLTEDGYRRAQFVHDNFGDDPEEVAMAGGMMMETYFGSDKERFHKAEEHEGLQNQIASHQFAVAALAGALLQNAKQGISLAHGGLAACPDGRLIGTQPLKAVIWQGRNQAIHWEEGAFSPPVRQCFDILAQLDFGHFE